MAKYNKINLIGKLFNKAEIDKNNMMSVVRQEIEVAQNLRHPFIPKFYQVIETKNHILKLS